MLVRWSAYKKPRESFDFHYIKKFYPRNVDNFAFSPSVGASGGILTVWNSSVGVITLGCLKVPISQQTARPAMQQSVRAHTTEAKQEPNRAGQTLRMGSAPTPSTHLSNTTLERPTTSPHHDPQKGRRRSSAARRACSAKSKHAALSPQGPRGQ